MGLARDITDIGDNEVVLRKLEEAVREKRGVVPFVGAGLSYPYHFPLWRDFLLELAGNASRTGAPPDFADTVRKRLDLGQFEEAAGDIETAMTPGRFRLHFTDAFGSGRLRGEDLTKGTAAVLPRLAVGPVITTNFDGVLEEAFRLAGRPFVDRAWGTRIPKVFPRFSNDERILIKLHGDVDDPDDRILTLGEYERHYGTTSPAGTDLTKELPGILSLMLSRPTLFIGCSLDKDRTIDVLTGFARQLANVPYLHFAILERPTDDGKFAEKIAGLLGRKIRPVWFPPAGFDAIEQILEHLAELVPKDAPAVPAAREPRESRTNIVFDSKDIYGRETEIEQVAAFMRTDRFATLHGPAGSGKTELAIRVGRALLDHFEHGVYLVRLAPLRESPEIPSAIGVALGLQEQAERPPTDALIDYLEDRHCLLVLDNCEHLVDACREMVKEILDRTERVSILTTSRQLLDLPGESRWPVPPLPVPAEEDVRGVADLEAHGATQLFIQRARDRLPTLTASLTPDDLAAIARICRKLDGIPLAIEFAAAQVTAYSIEGIEKQIEERFAFLGAKRHSEMHHHETLEAAVSWSYALLDEDQQALLRGVSVFIGGWSEDAARAVVYGDVAPEPGVRARLEELVDRSLVEMRPGLEGPRYSLLETLREYGLARLREVGETDVLRGTHLVWATRLVEEGGPLLVKKGAKEWLDRFDVDQPNIRAALNRALEMHKHELALRTGASFWRFWELRGYLNEGRRLLADLLRRTGEGHDALRARVLSGAGILAYRQGDSAVALDQFTKAYDLERAQSPVNVARLAECHNDLGIVNQQRGELDAAKRAYEEASRLFDQVHETRQAAIARYNSGNAAYESGELEDARRILTAAAAEFEENEMMAELGFPLTSLGRVLIHLGDFEEARERLERARDVRKEHGIKGGMAASLHGLARLALARGDGDGALELLVKAIRLQREVGDRKGTALSLETFALHAMSKGDAQRAAVLMASARRILDELGLPERPVDRSTLDEARAFIVDSGAARAEPLPLNAAIEFAIAQGGG